MSPLRHHQRLATWVTLFTLVLALMAPTVSRAMAFVQGEVAPWGEVCSLSDKLAASQSGKPADRAAHALDHCPFCALQADQPMLPSASAAHGAVPAFAHAQPPATPLAHLAVQAWPSALARAPPLRG